MAKINKDDYSKKRPKVTVEDLEGGDAMALTIASVEDSTFDDEDGKKKALVLTFEEAGEKVFYPNQTSLGFIIDEYGDETDEWIGKPLPLMKNTGTFRGKSFTNLQVPAPELWVDIIEGSDLTPVRKPRAAKVAVKKSAKKGGRGR